MIAPLQPAAADVTLTLDPNPGSTGGNVGGVIEIRQVPLRATELTLELTCTYFSRRGKESSISVVWQDIARFPCRMRADGAIEVPFCFYVPEEAPNTVEPPGDHYTWRLEVRSTLNGESFIRHWNVPVTASGVQASPAIAALAAMAAPASVVDGPLHLTHDDSGLSMDYPAGRFATAAGYLLAFGLAMLGVCVLCHFRHGDIATQLFSGLFGVPASAGGLWLLGNALHVEVRRGSLLIRRRLFGLPVRKTELPLSSVAGIGVAKSGFSMQGAEAQVFYLVQVKDSQGAIHTVSEGLVGYSAAMHAARRLSELTGLKLRGGPPVPAPIQPQHEPAQHMAAEPVQRAAAQPMPAANTFVDRVIDNRRAISSYQYIGQGIVAVVLLVVGYFFGARQLPVLLQGTKTTGTIVDSKKEIFKDSKRSKTGYMPIVEFWADGRTVRVQGHWARDSRPTNGETIAVFYDAANPDNAVVDAGIGNWVPGVPIASVGVFLLIVALRSWLAAHRD